MNLNQAMGSITRRGFVAGLAAGAAATTSLISQSQSSVLAGASEANLSKDKDSSNDKGGRWSWSEPPAPIEDEDVSQVLDCDILVLGAGSGGVPATLYAAEQGVSVICMSKSDGPEANGWSCASYNNGDLDTQYEVKAYDPIAMRQLHALRANGRANTAMFGNMMDRSGEALAYIANQVKDDYPMSIAPDTMQGRVSESTHLMYYWVDNDDLSTRYDAFLKGLSTLADKAQEAGAQFLYGTPAVQLVIAKDGSVAGAYGLAEDGSYIKVNASKGVLIATGNIADDEEMLECFAPSAKGFVSLTAAAGSHTGDGHKMAMWAGALMDKPPFALGLSATTFGRGVGAFYAVPFLRVNKNGSRYCNETLGTHELSENQPLCNADSEQPGHTGFQILDSHYKDAYANFGNNWERMQIDDITELSSGVYQSDTIEGLAEQIGVPADNLVATVERFNSMVDAGEDSDFGVPADTLMANGGVHDGPFYALEQTGCLGYTIGGPRTNIELQVVNASGAPIPGLWVCGNALGGQWGYEFSYQDFGGTNKMGAIVGGMLAIKSMLGTFNEAF